ncbi:MAG: CPBP family intramembrane glutamic endopeptidase, partial [Gaiellales bacterium]
RPDLHDAVYSRTFVAGSAVQVVLFAGYALLAARLSRAPWRPSLAVLATPLRPAVRLYLLAMAVIVPLNLAADRISNASARQGIAPDRLPADRHEWLLLAVCLVVLGVGAPVSEELLFRGLGFATLGRFALPATSLLFAVAHALPVLIPPVLIVGLVLGELRRRTHSILPGIAVHATLNLGGLVVALLIA